MGAAAIEVTNDDEAMNEQLVQDIKALGDIPVVLGGRTNDENCVRRMRHADAVFVGRHFENNNFGGYVDKAAVKRYMDRMKELIG